jgi:hypothetical protein
MRFVGTIHEPIYDFNNKKYMRVIVPDSMIDRVAAKHTTWVKDNPLDGKVLTIKVPFRYRRVMCKNMGTRPLQSLIKGDLIELEIEFMGQWTAGDCTGYTWKLSSFR